ncbi:hypothetical protein E4U57_004357 [Claviceps arundinis]|uniref:Uncharacterized protein n=1 Tax=Claviceps arundinis TaxID=1623583 RepID=A0A9P7MPI8_9HYPO|nr:hypothetical protein E4U57_004357 [Claviceps arundinis]KAG5961560.1 hypothetical protein E4U56_003816 [Claviceps arundinis]
MLDGSQELRTKSAQDPTIMTAETASKNVALLNEAELVNRHPQRYQLDCNVSYQTQRPNFALPLSA